MKKLLFIITLFLNGAILFIACKKDQIIEEEVNYEAQTVEDNSLAESTFSDVTNITEQAIANPDSNLSTYRLGNSQNRFLSNCASVTNTPNVPGPGGTIIVNFGTLNCQCSDGRWRRGIIIVSYTGSYRDSGTVVTSTFSNYFVGKDTSNMFQVTGTKTVTNKGRNSNSNFNYDISVDGHLTNNVGVVMDWTSTRNREWVAGYSTLNNWTDDTYHIRGTAQGKNFEGKIFTVTITSPLVVNLGCRWIKAGKFELTPAGLPVRYFDYGGANGDCDANASVTINGRQINFILR